MSIGELPNFSGNSGYFPGLERKIDPKGSFDGRKALLWASGATTRCCGFYKTSQSNTFLIIVSLVKLNNDGSYNIKLVVFPSFDEDRKTGL